MTTLSGETELRILICHHPLTPFSGATQATDHQQNDLCRFRVSARHKASGTSLPVYIRVYNFEEFQAKLQDPSGRAIGTNDCCVFTARSSAPSDIIFRIDVLDGEASNNQIGCCHVSGRDMGKPTDKMYVITGQDGEAHSEISVQTHAIHPWPGLKDYRHLEPQVWTGTGQTKICGHRGMGRTIEEKFSLVELKSQGSVAHPENTISAFKEAHRLGLSVVEMDVCVSKDGVPFVFHDFEADLAIQEDSTGQVHELTTAHLMHMTYKEIKVLREDRLLSEHKAEKYMLSTWLRMIKGFLSNNLQQNMTNHTQKGLKCAFQENGLPEDCKQFPRLREALESVDQDLAFHIEVKFPMTYVTGQQESPATAPDREVLINTILDVVYKYGRDRKIIFSGFDPDICILLRLKQHRYPVLLVNFGPTEKYDSYAGLRCTSAEIALAMAMSEKFQGLNGHSEDYTKAPWLVTKLHTHDMILWVWGEENNDMKYLMDLKKLGVDYITTDKVEMAQSSVVDE